MTGGFDDAGMTFRQPLVIAVVAAANHSSNRNKALQAMAQYQFVAFLNAVQADVQVPEFIVFPDIDTSIVEHQIRLQSLQ